jgi:hypothetical protein
MQIETEIPESIQVSVEGGDDRGIIQPSDKSVLILEDDVRFGRALLEIARGQGFKGLIASRADAGLAMVQKFRLDGITLDLRLPDMNGWTLFDRFKHDPATRHIPVVMITGEDARVRALREGAWAFLRKPAAVEALSDMFVQLKAYADRKSRLLLIVGGESTLRRELTDLLGGEDITVNSAETGDEALKTIKDGAFDCLVLDLTLPDMKWNEFLVRMKDDLGRRKLPVVLYCGRDLMPAERKDLEQLSEELVLSTAASPAGLLNETSLFLHRSESSLEDSKRQLLTQLRQSADPMLVGLRILLVDDDARNAFAITSILERHSMQLTYVENGRAAIDTLRKKPDFDAVLMDIMMPEMDGYKTMRAIRKIGKFKSLPIIALTAKAMRGDREKCIDAGASDYISKPVSVEQLLSVLRVWLHPHGKPLEVTASPKTA